MGCCEECGFDLGGLPERPGVCPECGSAFQRPGAWDPGKRPQWWRLLVAGCWPSLAAVLVLLVLADTVGLPRWMWILGAGVGLATGAGAARAVSMGFGLHLPRRERRESEIAVRASLMSGNIAVLLIATPLFALL